MNTGTVKFFNAAKGFGFIVDDATGKDVFVHITGLPNGITIQEKDKVQFEIEDGKKGPSAVKVQKL